MTLAFSDVSAPPPIALRATEGGDVWVKGAFVRSCAETDVHLRGQIASLLYLG